MIKNRMTSALVGTFAIALVGFIGCTDSSVDTGTTTVLEKYSAYDVDTQTLATGQVPSLERILSVGGEIPTYDETLNPDSSTCGSRDHKGEFRMEGQDGRKGGHGRGHGPKGRRGLGELIPKSYRRAIDSLGLTAGQDSLITLCFQQARQCGVDAQQIFLSERRSIDSAMRPSLDSIRTLVKAGTMTRDEARTAVDAIKGEYADRVAAMNTIFKESIASCRATLDGCIRGHLTEDQLVIWNRLTM